jgi:Tfp pilus assembly protein PilF
MERGDLPKARGELEAVLAENSEYVEARVSLGLVHYRSGDYDVARAEWQTCLLQAPDHPKARAFLNMPRAKAGAGGGNG